MHRQWVHPKQGWVFWVADGDVSAQALAVAGAGPMPEDRCHVGECPEAVSCEGGVGGDV